MKFFNSVAGTFGDCFDTVLPDISHPARHPDLQPIILYMRAEPHTLYTSSYSNMHTLYFIRNCFHVFSFDATGLWRPTMGPATPVPVVKRTARDFEPPLQQDLSPNVFTPTCLQLAERSAKRVFVAPSSHGYPLPYLDQSGQPGIPYVSRM